MEEFSADSASVFEVASVATHGESCRWIQAELF